MHIADVILLEVINDQCWDGSFMSHLSLFLMYWFFMMLILIETDVEYQSIRV